MSEEHRQSLAMLPTSYLFLPATFRQTACWEEGDFSSEVQARPPAWPAFGNQQSSSCQPKVVVDVDDDDDDDADADNNGEATCLAGLW